MDLEINLDDEKNILSLARKYTLFYQNENNFLEPKTKLELNRLVQQNYDNYWKENIKLLPKAPSFITYKFNHEREKYLNLIKNIKHRVALSRLRLSSHQLMIGKGRHP